MEVKGIRRILDIYETKTMENYLYTAYTLYKWECETEDEFCERYNDCQTMVNFYKDKVVIILTDETKTKTIDYKEFTKEFSYNNFYDLENLNN